MNKVKIFLGVACLSVALASAAFTNANAKFADPEYYITTGTIPSCEILSPVSNCSGTTNDCTVTVQGQGTVQVYDERDANGCKTPLKKN
jgi:hypothetical protein